MKKYIAFLTIALALVACKKAQPTGEQYQAAPVLETSTGTVQFACQGGEAIVSASTYETLVAKTQQEWLTVAVEGHDVVLKATENTSIESRYATVEMSSAGASREIQIIQFGVNSKYIWEEAYEFPKEGGSLDLLYQETAATIRVKITGIEWISAEAVDGVLSITVAKNEETEPREGVIEWIAGSDNRSIAISQAKGSGHGGGGGAGGVLFSEDFESEDNLDGWLFADVDGDNNCWEYADYLASHSGIGIIYSQSYINNVGPLTPDNWIVTPAITLSSDNYISFWVTGQDASYAEEHYGVYVSTTQPETYGDLDNFEKLFEATNPIDDPYETEVVSFTSSSGTKDYEWQRIVVNIPASYDNKTVYVALRHFNCTDMYYLNVDDVMVTAGLPAKTAASTPAVKTAPNGFCLEFSKKIK